MEWKGRVALVTGATSGIGEAVARTFARKGASVAFAGRSTDAGEAIAADIRKAGGDAMFITCDVRDPAQIDAMFEKTLAGFGRLDFAVNNAGLCPTATAFDAIDAAQWEASIETNLRGTLLCMQRQLRQMAAQGGGAIVNTSSMSSIRGAAGFAAYASSKYGVNGLTRAAAVEYAARNIRVNTVLPGVIDTPMTDAVMGEEGTKWALTRIPMRRIGSTQEMANPIVWLCSDEASYITGVVLPVDGGWEPG